MFFNVSFSIVTHTHIYSIVTTARPLSSLSANVTVLYTKAPHSVLLPIRLAVRQRLMTVFIALPAPVKNFQNSFTAIIIQQICHKKKEELSMIIEKEILLFFNVIQKMYLQNIKFNIRSVLTSLCVFFYYLIDHHLQL